MADSKLTLKNSGNLSTIENFDLAIAAKTNGAHSGLFLQNSGDIVTKGVLSLGIEAETDGADSPATVENSGNITVGASAGIQGAPRVTAATCP
jgi:hypothetical protein